ncbi:MerR family transcriptional regulator [Pseudonocardia xishanensis]|uniref:MerR family transcriptional regulator n=1 Tax=Pseudonocardia xishanensis TaxID=630995 RepID=A0ABP8RPB6_9PSEU
MARVHPSSSDRFDDEHYPAYTMGRAAEMLGTTAGFLRSLDEVGLLDPERSAGGHRRYSRHQLRLAGRVRALVDGGTALEAACRIVVLEDELDEARRLNAELHRRDPAGEPSADRPSDSERHPADHS